MERVRLRMRYSDFDRWTSISTFVLSAMTVACDMRTMLKQCAAKQNFTEDDCAALTHMEHVIREQCKLQLGVDLVRYFPDDRS